MIKEIHIAPGFVISAEALRAEIARMHERGVQSLVEGLKRSNEKLLQSRAAVSSTAS